MTPPPCATGIIMTMTAIIIIAIFLMPLNKFVANMNECCTTNILKRFIKTKNYFELGLKRFFGLNGFANSASPSFI